jgi:hypothetical protein
VQREQLSKTSKEEVTIMKTLPKFITLAVVILASLLQQASADILLGTTGSGNTPAPYSVLVEIDQDTGHLVRTIGPVGYKVNGLTWDRATAKLYATTSVKDKNFHGLITINPLTGAGTPVDASVVNFGLSGADSPVMAISINFRGQMVGWYQEFSGTTDTFVRINKFTGVATESPDTGIEAARVGLSFNSQDKLWLIDSPFSGPDGPLVQIAWLLDPTTGKPISAQLLSPPTAAALGDFSPSKNHYYGINKDPLGADPTAADLVVINLKNGKVRTVGPTVRDLHTLTFAKLPSHGQSQQGKD